MVVKDETLSPPQKNIRITKSPSLNGPYTAPSEPITGKHGVEGLTSIRKNYTWFVYFDKYRERKTGTVILKDMKTC
jgi:hypothetical protein